MTVTMMTSMMLLIMIIAIRIYRCGLACQPRSELTCRDIAAFLAYERDRECQTEDGSQVLILTQNKNLSAARKSGHCRRIIFSDTFHHRISTLLPFGQTVKRASPRGRVDCGGWGGVKYPTGSCIGFCCRAPSSGQSCVELWGPFDRNAARKNWSGFGVK